MDQYVRSAAPFWSAPHPENTHLRTSITHPLEIATVEIGPGFGRIGLTLCPGKQQKHAATGAWGRDLALDLDAIERWGAAAVLTLVEKEELAGLGVPLEILREAVRARHMDWHYYPIKDGSAEPLYSGAWGTVGPELHALLRDGFDVLVHCKGGLGRAGTVAGKLLVELGMDSERAIGLVREARPGAIENPAQETDVRRTWGEVEALPDRSTEAVADRALGAMLGLAVGDAVGTTLEFAARDSKPRLTDMVGGGPFKLEPGQWTDDTAMALALMDSLAANPLLDEADLMRRFVAWQETGEYSCTGTCFDIGNTVRSALTRFKRTGQPFAGSTDPMSAGNGSLMRLAPVAIHLWRDRAALRDVAARQSRTTHGAAEAVDACVAFAEVLADAIAGYPRSQVLRVRDYPYVGRIGEIMAGSWRGRRRSEIRSSGYVAHSFEAALWCVGRTSSFADAVLLAANLGDDADTTAAITGQLAGALYGAEGIPDTWLGQLAWRQRVEAMTEGLMVGPAVGA
jgi:ADP-ribosyl-[dinitrogen reductase] hydrolase